MSPRELVRGRETRLQDQKALPLHTHTHTPVHGLFHTGPRHSTADHIIQLHNDVRAWRDRTTVTGNAPMLRTSGTPQVPLQVLLTPT